VPAAITFDRHPQSLFTPAVPPLINTIEDRIRLLKQFGMEEVSVLPVTKEVMSTEWQAFLEHLVAEGVAGFVCGEDFRFGARGEGNAEKLAQFCRQRGLIYRVVQDRLLEGVRISSTHIRALLEAGQTEQANTFLGHPHILSGEVISGRQLGRTIGVPTANLRLPAGVLVPRFGVYACRALFDGEIYPAVTNVGTRPTVNGSHVTVEPWILDFSGDLYGRSILLEFHGFLRPEEKFASLEALQKEIQKNAGQTRDFFKK